MIALEELFCFKPISEKFQYTYSFLKTHKNEFILNFLSIVFQHESEKIINFTFQKLETNRSLKPRRLIEQTITFHCHYFYQFYFQAMIEKSKTVTFYRSLGKTVFYNFELYAHDFYHAI